ncbi:MAG: ribonuclease HII [bacterium]
MPNLIEEKEIFSQGYKIVGSLDEAGRGPLAGPVVAACVVVVQDFCISDDLKMVRDSKKLSAKKREELYDLIFASFPEVGIGICDHETIDRINILQASFLAMKKAISSLKAKPDHLLVDGKFSIPNVSTAQTAIIRGDEIVFSISAASIIAKVVRDRIMRECHEKYPQYEFDKHKGYGTKIHLDNLKKYGPCEIHRKSFAPIKNLLRN